MTAARITKDQADEIIHELDRLWLKAHDIETGSESDLNIARARDLKQRIDALIKTVERRAI